MQQFQRQRGATLLVALILLLVMTLFAVSSINMGTTNLKVVSNMQAVKVLDQEVLVAMEQVISDPGYFTSPPTNPIALDTNFDPNIDVFVQPPSCMQSQPATGYSALNTTIIPEDNLWEIEATVTDTVTGASSTMHTGVEMRMLAGNCP